MAILLEKLQIDEGACVQLLGLAQYNERGLYYARNLQVALGNIHSGSKRHTNPSALVTAQCREKMQHTTQCPQTQTRLVWVAGRLLANLCASLHPCTFLHTSFGATCSAGLRTWCVLVPRMRA